MGLVYTTILQDDFDWKYVGTSKKQRLEEFVKEFGEAGGDTPSLEGQWYGHAVFDLEKTPPYLDKYKNIILKYCDTAIYWNDSTPYNKIKL